MCKNKEYIIDRVDTKVILGTLGKSIFHVGREGPKVKVA
jgi:hypothetical protein